MRKWLVLWIIAVPVGVLGIMPWTLAQYVAGTTVWEGRAHQWLGAWLVLEGLGLTAWCAALFLRGRGTPAVPCPPQQMVIDGPYRFTRNPLALSLVVVLAGEALLYSSWAVAAYALVLMVSQHLHVIKHEEPELAKRFGPCYRTYCTQVPRWIPRTGTRVR